MPEYRKLHHCFDMGERTSKLSDFEFRVWLTYRAAADDFGVCPMLPGALKGISRWLSRTKDDRPVVTDSALLKAMSRIAQVGLAITFEHQGLRYLCQPDWQDFEDIQWPSVKTKNPLPPSEVLESFSEKTFELLKKHPAVTGGPTRARDRGREALALTEAQTQTQTQTEILEEREKPFPRRATHAPSVAGASNIDWWRKHGAHVEGLCGWMCFANDQADEFAGRLSSIAFDVARDQVVAWARSVRQQWEREGRVPTGRMYDFWTARWQEEHGASNAAAKGFDPLGGIKEAMRG